MPLDASPCAQACCSSAWWAPRARSCRTCWRSMPSPTSPMTPSCWLGGGLAYCPRIVLNQATLPALLDAASAGILVQHRCALFPALISRVVGAVCWML